MIYLIPMLPVSRGWISFSMDELNLLILRYHPLLEELVLAFDPNVVEEVPTNGCESPE